MTKKVTLTLTIFSVILFSRLSAQNVYFTGVGRALVTNETLSDKTNTASKLKSSAGYTLFDLGIYAKPSEVLRGGVILRTRNEFGGFFQDGATLLFRQMQLEGLIAKKAKYEIGDVYFTHTKYTIWNEESMFPKYEAGVFSLRRDIINYENFYVGNAWRLQGVNLKGRVNFSKGIESIGLRAYGGRNRQTNFTIQPERYFYGGRVDITQSKYLRIGGNLAGISDIPGTVATAEVNYQNMVYTGDFALTYDNSDKFKVELSGELGASKFELKRMSDTTDNKFEDFFYDLGIKGTYKPLNLTVGASYRDVGYNFNSPMAQTRRLNYPGGFNAYTFNTMNDGTTLRPIGLFDFYSQEGGGNFNLYNQSISTTLMPYYIQYDMVEPYGRATPNRKGFTFDAEIKHPDNLVDASFEANLLSEGVSEGDSVGQAKRKFTLMRGGFVFKFNKLLKWEKTIALNTGIRTESSTRTGINPINLSSSLLDLGLDVEVLKDLHLLGGTKFFAVKGNEIQTYRDQLNQIVSFGTGSNFNQTQNIIATGIRYDYGTGGYFSVNYHMVDSQDKLAPTMNYKLNQLFFVFGLKF